VSETLYCTELIGHYGEEFVMELMVNYMTPPPIAFVYIVPGSGFAVIVAELGPQITLTVA